jgi:hypothetical protein
MVGGNYDIALGEPDTSTANVSNIGGFNLAFDRLAIRGGTESGGNPAAQGFWDEIRIGDTFADVAPIPEPAVLGLLAIGILFLARRRPALQK